MWKRLKQWVLARRPGAQRQPRVPSPTDSAPGKASYTESNQAPKIASETNPATNKYRREVPAAPASVSNDDRSDGTRRDLNGHGISPPSPSFEGLPAELHAHIFTFGLGLDDLKATVRASPAFYRNYSSFDRKILLRTALGESLGHAVVDAWAAFTSASLEITHPNGYVDRQAAVDFMTIYLEHQYSCQPEVFLRQVCQVTDLVWMANLYFSVLQPLTLHFSTSFLSELRSSLESVSYPHLQPNLTSTESTRFMRAICRVQLWCHLFGKDYDWRWAYGSGSEMVCIFHECFEPWEVEEMLCIFVPIKQRYERLLTETAQPLHDSGFFYNGDPDGTDWYNWDDPQFQKKLVIGTLSRGLANYALLVRTPGPDMETLVRLVRKNWVYGPQYDLLSATEDHHQRREEHPSAKDLREEAEEPMPFLGDIMETRSPPLAWALKCGKLYRNYYGEYRMREELRARGYVFWDSDRLDRSGAMDLFMRF